MERGRAFGPYNHYKIAETSFSSKM
jgi:hypothetical protein